MVVTPSEVGGFVDKISSQAGVERRTTTAVAGRFIEEAVELCLATGMNPNAIMGHVMDSIHNQAGKAGRRADKVIYPSQYNEEVVASNIAEEAADCSLVLKDLVFLAGIDIDAEERKKWDKFIQRTFNVSASGTLYAIKKQD